MRYLRKGLTKQKWQHQSPCAPSELRETPFALWSPGGLPPEARSVEMAERVSCQPELTHRSVGDQV